MKTRLSLAAITLLTFAAPAQAAEIRSEVECVRVIPGQQTMPLSGIGFAPEEYVTFTADGQTLSGARSDAAGNVAGVFYPPSFSSFDRMQQTFSIAARDGFGNTAPAIQVPMSRVAVKAPDRAKPRKLVRFRVYGFLAAKKVFVHIRRGGRTRRTVGMGTTAGPCGTLTRRMRYLPLRKWKPGTYEYHFSHTRKWSKQTTIYIMKIVFYRTFG